MAFCPQQKADHFRICLFFCMKNIWTYVTTSILSTYVHPINLVFFLIIHLDVGAHAYSALLWITSGSKELHNIAKAPCLSHLLITPLQYLILVPSVIHTKTSENVCVQVIHLNETVTLSITIEFGNKNISLTEVDMVAGKDIFQCVSFQFSKLCVKIFPLYRLSQGSSQSGTEGRNVECDATRIGHDQKPK
ncbi:Pregnancy zone protein, partial [Ophiophagus hannah]